jgi:hypothetical protein
MQVVQDDNTKDTHTHSRRVLGVFVICVALTAAGASVLYLNQDSSGLFSGALALIAIVPVAGAWLVVGPVFAARLLALGQGMVWFFLLIHGGLGLVFGPMGWAASAIAGRVPRLAAALLAVPAAFLTVSWAPVAFGGVGLELREGLALLVLIPPALLAAAVLVRAHLQLERESATSPR